MINLLKRALLELILRWRYSFFVLRFFEFKKKQSEDARKISVAITHYNYASLIHYSWFNLIYDSRISEVIILDDGSDKTQLNALLSKAKHFNKKVKVYRRNSNRGALANKIEAVELCKENWILLLDSDNTYFKHSLDRLFDEQNWEKNTIYCPGFAYPHFDFRSISSSDPLEFNKVKSELNNGNSIMTFLNDGNYFFQKHEFLKSMAPVKNYVVLASEVAFMNYVWLKNNNYLKIITELQYLHRLHQNSLFIKNSRHSPKELDIIRTLFNLPKDVEMEKVYSFYNHHSFTPDDTFLCSKE